MKYRQFIVFAAGLLALVFMPAMISGCAAEETQPPVKERPKDTRPVDDDDDDQTSNIPDDDASVVDDDATPVADDDLSPDDDVSPDDDDNDISGDTTIDDDQTIDDDATDDDTTPGDDVTPDDDLTPDDDQSPMDDDATPDDDLTPPDDDLTPPDDDLTPPDDDLTPPDDDLTPPDDDTTPPDDDDDSTPVQNPLGLTDVKFVATIGDSLAAGYNAEPRGAMSFHGLMAQNNNSAYPQFAGRDMKTLWPGLTDKNIGDSGATSDEIYDNTRRALGLLGSFPKDVDGDVVIFLSSGGNDFNDDVQTIISTQKTEQAAAKVAENNGKIYDLLRDHYGKNGWKLVVLQMNIHDPTDGQGTIPPGFSEGFCEKLSNPLFLLVKDIGLSNLNLFNQRIAEFVAQQPEGVLVDNYSLFMNHAMNASGGDRWIDDDCVHPNNQGHHQIRALLWELMTGERI